jgi:copper chaperone
MGDSICVGEAMNKEVPMLRYQVDDMTCGHCVQTITNAVKGIDPSAEVRVDLTTKSVEVSGRGEPDAFARAIREAGYTPQTPQTPQTPEPQSRKGGCCGHC